MTRVLLASTALALTSGTAFAQSQSDLLTTYANIAHAG